MAVIVRVPFSSMGAGDHPSRLENLLGMGKSRGGGEAGTTKSVGPGSKNTSVLVIHNGREAGAAGNSASRGRTEGVWLVSCVMVLRPPIGLRLLGISVNPPADNHADNNSEHKGSSYKDNL